MPFITKNNIYLWILSVIISVTMTSERLSLAELNTQPPDYQLARKLLKVFFPYQSMDRAIAREMLCNYHLYPENLEFLHRDTNLRNMGLAYWALSVMRCEGMGESHKMDPKRADRSLGQRLRRDRTGSRRG